LPIESGSDFAIGITVEDCMHSELVKSTQGTISGTSSGPILPAIIAAAGEKASRRFIEFFTATIRNGNTRRAYARAVVDFLDWCQQRGLPRPGIEPVHVAA
jgi:hypothetical protein